MWNQQLGASNRAAAQKPVLAAHTRDAKLNLAGCLAPMGAAAGLRRPKNFGPNSQHSHAGADRGPTSS